MPLSTTSAKVAPRRKRIQATVDAGTKVASTCVRHAAHTTPPSRKDTYTSPRHVCRRDRPAACRAGVQAGRSPERQGSSAGAPRIRREPGTRRARPCRRTRPGCRRRASGFPGRPASRGRAARPWAPLRPHAPGRGARARCFPEGAPRTRRRGSAPWSTARPPRNTAPGGRRTRSPACGRPSPRLASASRPRQGASAPGRSPPASSCAAPGRGPCTWAKPRRRVRPSRRSARRTRSRSGRST